MAVHGRREKWLSLPFCGGVWDAQDGTDGDLKSCSLFAAPVESLVFREKSLEGTPQFFSHVLEDGSCCCFPPCSVDVLDPRTHPRAVSKTFASVSAKSGSSHSFCFLTFFSSNTERS